jgi:(R)-2-hydroxy-4-methylpentanoate CoA-transferase
MGLPLEGVKVISLCNFVAGTTTTRYFSEFGAEVIQIEAMKGDPWRYHGTSNNVPANDEENEVFDIFNAHKKCICLDLKQEKGKEIFFKMLEDADAFVTNTRPQGLKRLGIDYDSIKDRFPKLVYGMLTGYGMKGRDAEKPGYDGVAFFTNSGLSRDAVEESGYPMVPPPSGGDIFTGTTLFAGVLMAMLNAQKTGNGDLIEVSLYGAATWMCAMPSLITQPRFDDAYPKKRLGVKPFNTSYKCKDGEWVTLWVMQYDRYYRDVLDALEIPQYADDPRFKDSITMLKNRADVIKIFDEAFSKIDSTEIMRRFVEKDVTAAFVKHYKDLHKDPQALENDFMREVTYANGNKAVMPMIPIKSLSAGRIEFKKAPTLGENTVEVLKNMNYTDEQINEFRASGLVK